MEKLIPLEDSNGKNQGEVCNLAFSRLTTENQNLLDYFQKKRDIQIADAVLELFRRSRFIENFNKKHLYLLIREMTDCKTHYITKVVNVMKQHQKKMLNDYLETGDFTVRSEPFWVDISKIDLTEDDIDDE